MSGRKPSDVESEQGNEQDSEKNTVQQTEIVKNTVQDPGETTRTSCTEQWFG